MTGFLTPSQLPNFQAALRDATSGSPDARWVAAIALGTVTGKNQEAAIEALEKLFEDPCEEIRAQALEGLADQARKNCNINTLLVEASLADPSPAVRCTGVDAAVTVLEFPVSHILPLARDVDVSVRISVARTLGILKEKESQETLIQMLDDAKGIVRFEAAVALAELDNAIGESLLLEALGGPSEDVCVAARALGLLKSKNGEKHLKKLARKLFLSAETRSMVAAALARIGATRGRDTLSKMLASRSTNGKLIALSALAQLPISGMTKEVGTLMESPDPIIVSSSIHTLAALAEEDRDAVIKTLENKRSYLSRELKEELEETIESIGNLT